VGEDNGGGETRAANAARVVAQVIPWSGLCGTRSKKNPDLEGATGIRTQPESEAMSSSLKRVTPVYTPLLKESRDQILGQ